MKLFLPIKKKLQCCTYGGDLFCVNCGAKVSTEEAAQEQKQFDTGENV